MKSMKRGKVIVFGGNDGVGKRTQTQLFVERLNASGYIAPAKAIFYTFPAYDSFWGQMVSRYLGRGEPLDDVVINDPFQTALLYELDRRAEALSSIIPELDKGNWAVCDRYTESNMAHQTVRFETKAEQDNFLKTLEFVQYRYLRLPKPDLVLILTLSSKVRAAQTEARRQAYLAGNKGKTHGQVAERDRLEQDLDHMEKVNLFYPQLAKRFGWPVVSCSRGEEQFSREQISDKIWEIFRQEYHFAG
jgi:dTMP kinase